MILFVSSYSDSFAPGTFLVHSGDSANASSALQLLDTRMPDHDPDFVRGEVEEPAGLDQFEAFIEHGGRVDGDLVAHAPGGVGEGLVKRHGLHLIKRN